MCPETHTHACDLHACDVSETHRAGLRRSRPDTCRAPRNPGGPSVATPSCLPIAPESRASRLNSSGSQLPTHMRTGGQHSAWSDTREQGRPRPPAGCHAPLNPSALCPRRMTAGALGTEASGAEGWLRGRARALSSLPSFAPSGSPLHRAHSVGPVQTQTAATPANGGLAPAPRPSVLGLHAGGTGGQENIRSLHSYPRPTGLSHRVSHADGRERKPCFRSGG